MGFDEGAIASGVVGAGGLVWWLMRQAVYVSRAHDTAETNKAAIADVRSELSEFKESVAKEYTHVTASAAMEQRLLAAIAQVSAQIGVMNNRLERLFVPVSAPELRDH